MAITKWLARDLTFEVRDVDGITWLAIGGLQSVTHSPAKTDADTTDFDSNGRNRHIPASRGDSFALAGQALEDTGTGEQDPGQERVEALGRLTGLSALGRFRATSARGNAKEFDGSVDVTLPGGGTNDAASWAATVLVDGAITELVTEDKAARLVDFDAFRAEQRAEPVQLKIGGELYDLPAEMPAAVALEVVSLKQEQGEVSDIPPERIKAMAEGLFGKELLATITIKHKLGIGELAQLVVMVFGQYNEAQVPKNRATRRTKTKRPASSSA